MTMVSAVTAKTMPAGEFKAKCLSLMDQVAADRMPVIITKRGKPVAKLVPIDEKPAVSCFGHMRGTGRIVGDIVGPTGEVWFADQPDAKLYQE